MDKQTAQIDNWELRDVFGGGQCLVGIVSNHPAQSSFLMPYQMTTNIVKLDLENRVAETHNTVYTLGVPYKPMEFKS